jgi:hypothetical protein
MTQQLWTMAAVMFLAGFISFGGMNVNVMGTCRRVRRRDSSRRRR